MPGYTPAWIVMTAASGSGADMEAAGLTIKTEPYVTRIPRSQRGGEVVEPMMSTQWYVRIQPLADKAHRGCARGARQNRAGALSRRSIFTGWRIFRTGASAASSGGGIASRPGIARKDGDAARRNLCRARGAGRRRLD